jgi:predicted metal-dependent phosphoesterase TrpH
MIPMIDLHTHTTASDGSLDLQTLMIQAKAAKLKAIAVTDHDTVGSAIKITGHESVKAIPGIELSVFDDKLGYMDIHVLGIRIDPQNHRLTSELKKLAIAREDQKKATVEKLRSMGYDIAFEEVKAKAKGSVGRPHIASVLMEKRPGEFPTMSSVFEKLLGNDKPAYVGRQAGFSLKSAVNLIHDAGGLAFLAHPFVYECDVDKLIADFEDADGDGIEVYYDYITNRPEIPITEPQNNELIAHAQALALVTGLLQSGGSDFHGAGKGQTLGRFGAPDILLEKILGGTG